MQFGQYAKLRGLTGIYAKASQNASKVVVAVRDKEHSTIIYESPQPDTPLLRLGWNKQDPRYMATILMDSSMVVVLDIRYTVCLSANLPAKNHCKEYPASAFASWLGLPDSNAAAPVVAGIT